MYNEDREEMIELIEEYCVEHDACSGAYCNECVFLENCYQVAKQREDGDWAKSIDYAGCDTEEEFWETLLN